MRTKKTYRAVNTETEQELVANAESLYKETGVSPKTIYCYCNTGIACHGKWLFFQEETGKDSHGIPRSLHREWEKTVEPFRQLSERKRKRLARIAVQEKNMLSGGKTNEKPNQST